MAGTTLDRFLDAISESYDALLGAVEATEARGHTISKAILEEARKGEQEATALARKWVDAPTNVFENLAAMLDVQARAQQRVLELARDALGGAGEYRADVQDALRRLIKANAEAGAATVEVARKAYARARGGDGAEPARRKPARVTRVPVAAGTNSDGAADS